jgi:hypothetical protein
MWSSATLVSLLLALFLAASPRASASIVLSSSQASYVIDLEHGCSISGAWAEGDPAKTNLINTADLGRYVQVFGFSNHFLFFTPPSTGKLLRGTFPLR